MALRGVVGLAEDLRPPKKDPFVEQSPNVAMTGHAPGSRATGLRDTTNRLRVMFEDRRHHFLFGDIQAVTERSVGLGHWGVVERLGGKFHGGQFRRRALIPHVEVEIQSQLIGIFFRRDPDLSTGSQKILRGP